MLCVTPEARWKPKQLQHLIDPTESISLTPSTLTVRSAITSESNSVSTTKPTTPNKIPSYVGDSSSFPSTDPSNHHHHHHHHHHHNHHQHHHDDDNYNKEEPKILNRDEIWKERRDKYYEKKIVRGAWNNNKNDDDKRGKEEPIVLKPLLIIKSKNKHNDIIPEKKTKSSSHDSSSKLESESESDTESSDDEFTDKQKEQLKQFKQQFLLSFPKEIRISNKDKIMLESYLRRYKALYQSLTSTYKAFYSDGKVDDENDVILPAKIKFISDQITNLQKYISTVIIDDSTSSKILPTPSTTAANNYKIKKDELPAKIINPEMNKSLPSPKSKPIMYNNIPTIKVVSKYDKCILDALGNQQPKFLTCQEQRKQALFDIPIIKKSN